MRPFLSSLSRLFSLLLNPRQTVPTIAEMVRLKARIEMSQAILTVLDEDPQNRTQMDEAGAIIYLALLFGVVQHTGSLKREQIVLPVLKGQAPENLDEQSLISSEMAPIIRGGMLRMFSDTMSELFQLKEGAAFKLFRRIDNAADQLGIKARLIPELVPSRDPEAP